MLNKTNPKISIILVTYNSAKTINRCLESIRKTTQAPFEILIVDNASSDDTREKIKQSKIESRIILNNQNLGFSRANNIGIKQAKGDYLMFLNPDTKVKNNAIDRLHQYLVTHPEVGLVVPKLEDEDGTSQKSVRQLPTLLRAIKEYYLGIKSSYAPFVPLGTSAVDVESAVGAAMMVKKTTYQQVGGFDERYFLYFEDLDLCRKILRVNLKIKYLPEAIIVHRVGESASSNPRAAQLLKQSSAIYNGPIKDFLLFLLLRLRPRKNR